MHHTIEEYIDIDPKELREVIEGIERDIFRNAREHSEKIGRHITPEEYDMEVMSLIKLVKHLPMDLNSLDKFLEKREKVFEELKFKIYELEETNSELENENKELIAEIKRIRAKPSEELKKENAALHKKIAIIQKENDELEMKNSELEEQYEPLNNQIKVYNDIIKRSKLNFEVLLNTTDKLIEDLNGLPDEIKPVDTNP